MRGHGGNGQPRRCADWGDPDLRHKDRGALRRRAAGGATLGEVFTEGSGALCTVRGEDGGFRARGRHPRCAHPRQGKTPSRVQPPRCGPAAGEGSPALRWGKDVPVLAPTIPFSGHPLTPQTPTKSTGGEGISGSAGDSRASTRVRSCPAGRLRRAAAVTGGGRRHGAGPRGRVFVAASPRSRCTTKSWPHGAACPRPDYFYIFYFYFILNRKQNRALRERLRGWCSSGVSGCGG